MYGARKKKRKRKKKPHIITFIYVLNSATTALITRLRASYLNSALVRRRARALWKYNELVLTNHGTHLFLHILWYLMKSQSCLAFKFWTSNTFSRQQLHYSLSISLHDNLFGLHPNQITNYINFQLIICLYRLTKYHYVHYERWPVILLISTETLKIPKLPAPRHLIEY